MSKRRRNRRRDPDATKETATYVAAAFLILLSLGGIAGASIFYFMQPAPIKYDKTSGCPINGPVSATFIVLDTTDHLPVQAQQQVTNRLATIVERVGKHSLLELRTISAANPAGVAKFSRCSPGDGSNESELSSNPELMRKRWNRDFAKPLQVAIERSTTGGEADWSPIMETLQAVAINRIEPIAVRGSIPIRLFVVSDMMQNSRSYSHYKSGLKYSNFKNSIAHAELKTNLSGAEVHILYVQRLTTLARNGEHIQFWFDWIQDNQGIIGSSEKLQGVN